MKKLTITLSLVCLSVLLFAFSKASKEVYISQATPVKIEIPETVKAVIDNKCYGCHNPNSKGEKSKKKLNWDNFTNGEYSDVKLYIKLDKIEELVSENKMPPAKFLEHYPDKKVTPEEKELLINWAKGQKEILMEE
jgi:uncharacterized membrane protein